MLIDENRRLHRALHARRRAQRAADAVGLRAEDRELVGADTRDERFVAELCRQPPRRLAEHRVARRVAERPVDLGEALQVDQQNGECIALVCGPSSAAPTRSRNSVRFGSDVSGS